MVRVCVHVEGGYASDRVPAPALGGDHTKRRPHGDQLTVNLCGGCTAHIMVGGAVREADRCADAQVQRAVRGRGGDRISLGPPRVRTPPLRPRTAPPLTSYAQNEASSFVYGTATPIRLRWP